MPKANIVYTLEDFKKLIDNSGLKNAAIEKAVGLSNGIIGKVLAGKGNLSEEKFKNLESYLAKKIPANEIPIPATNVAINKVAENHRVDPDGGIHGIALYSMEKIKELTQIEGVTTGDKAPEPKKKFEPIIMEEPVYINRAVFKEDLIAKKVFDFCEKEGITPEDLIESYKSRNKPVKEKASDVLKKDQKSSVGQRYDLRAIKLGIKNNPS